jgi:ABC-type nitrate/sulfonate/bicarbonate transport system permease component
MPSPRVAEPVAQPVEAAPQLETAIRLRRLPRVPLALGVLSMALLLGVWSLAALYVRSRTHRADVLLPGPWNVVEDFRGIAVFRGPEAKTTIGNAVYALAENTWDSAKRLFLGILIGAGLGIGTGLVFGWSRRVRALAEGPLLVVRTIPLLALIPLFLTWFGGTDRGIVTFIAFAVFSMLLINTIEAIRNVSPVVRSFARTLGASELRVYRTVVVPAIVPELAGGVRVVIGLSWAILLAGEFIGAQTGIGHILILAQQYSYTSRMVLIVILIMLYTFLLDRGFALLSRRVTRWIPT